MSKYKMIVCDCDGTLLNNNHFLSSRTINSLKFCEENGLKVIVATGRPIMGIDFISNLFTTDFPFITYNGAKVVKIKSNEVLYHKVLSQNSAKHIIETAEKLNVQYIVWSNDNLYVNVINDETHFYESISNVKAKLIKDKTKLLQDGIDKIIWYTTNDIITKYKYIMSEDLKDTNCEPSTSFFLEFFHKDASKGQAVKLLSEYYNIDLDDIICVGDNFNDLSMIKIAGLGVAMGNAVDEVKEKADYVTDSNELDGVSKVIDKYIKM